MYIDLFDLFTDVIPRFWDEDVGALSRFNEEGSVLENVCPTGSSQSEFYTSLKLHPFAGVERLVDDCKPTTNCPVLFFHRLVRFD
jgi:hypothetical protein